MKTLCKLFVLFTFLLSVSLTSQPVLAAQKINLNTATVTELTQVKGIGEKMAVRIVDYRKEHKFNSIDDLLNVKGIGEKSLKKYSSSFTVGEVKQKVTKKK